MLSHQQPPIRYHSPFVQLFPIRRHNDIRSLHRSDNYIKSPSKMGTYPFGTPHTHPPGPPPPLRPISGSGPGPIPYPFPCHHPQPFVPPPPPPPIILPSLSSLRLALRLEYWCPVSTTTEPKTKATLGCHVRDEAEAPVVEKGRWEGQTAGLKDLATPLFSAAPLLPDKGEYSLPLNAGLEGGLSAASCGQVRWRRSNPNPKYHPKHHVVLQVQDGSLLLRARGFVGRFEDDDDEGRAGVQSHVDDRGGERKGRVHVVLRTVMVSTSSFYSTSPTHGWDVDIVQDGIQALLDYLPPSSSSSESSEDDEFKSYSARRSRVIPGSLLRTSPWTVERLLPSSGCGVLRRRRRHRGLGRPRHQNYAPPSGQDPHQLGDTHFHVQVICLSYRRLQRRHIFSSFFFCYLLPSRFEATSVAIAIGRHNAGG
ncbi:hypothetical protein BDN72DRAFT_899560 [Pluteus cervinus]|uniref:Uncharacterized protein n=1 Tax=Pluteus cervinus TaxID=181527 RepID=A0ACD3AMI6_9AGAR|nr:hypothetical protein BDN72DRAFT_899560 [Pluteus cervinus]